MKARSIKTRDNVRFGPTTMDRTDTWDIRVQRQRFSHGVEGEEGYKLGTIDIYMRERYVRIWNPRQDELTRQEIVTWIPMEVVSGWEPLSETEAQAVYHGNVPPTPPLPDDTRPSQERARTLPRSVA